MKKLIKRKINLLAFAFEVIGWISIAVAISLLIYVIYG